MDVTRKSARKWIDSLSLRVQQALFAAATYLILLAICLLAISPEQYDLSVGDVAPKTITASKDIVDELTTERRRQAAADAVSPVYYKDDTVSDTVLSDMDAVFSELRAVRELGEQIRNAWGDEGGAFTEADYAQASGLVTRLSLSNYQLRTLMNTGESDFESLYQSLVSATRTTLVSTITEGQINDAINNIQQIVSYNTRTDLWYNVAIPTLRACLKANMLIDQAATEENRQKACDAVEPTVYKQDQNIVVKGDRVTAEQIAVLESLGLLEGNSFDYPLYIGTAITLRQQLPPDKPWFCFAACIFYNAVCWLITAAAYYPATHAVRMMVEDDNFAQTWYAFWVLPLVFILLNLFMIPRYPTTLQTGRVLQVYIVMSIALLFLMLFFNAIFLLMAISINRNARLQQENQFLSMQQQRYESLKAAIEEARQARHDMRHQMNQLSALAEAGDLDGLKTYLAKTVSRIPELDMSFCENRAADSVVGYYCALAKREGIPFCAKLDLPQTLPVDEIDMCLVLSNLLENAFEASLRTAPARRKIEVTAYVHAARLVLIEAENAFDGEINENSGVFRSSKRKGNGIGIQSVRHIAEKSGGASTVTYQDGLFCAKVMLRG